MSRRKRSKAFILLGGLFLFVLSPRDLSALNPGRALTDYHIRAWTAESGLPQNTVNVLAQSHDGYLWIGTPAGLVRFDGVRFRTFTGKDTPALKNARVLALHEDGDGVLWIGTDGGGLCSYDEGTWKTYTTGDGLSDNHVRAVISDGRGSLWAGTDYGLNRLSAKGIRRYLAGDGLYDEIITALAIDPRGNLWIGTLRGGLARLEGEAIRVYGIADGLLNMAVYALSADPQGDVWIGTQEGLYLLKQDEDLVQPVEGTRYTPITSLLIDKESSLWIGTMADGLKRVSGGALAGLSSEDGLPDNFVRSLLCDCSGTLWIGTDAGGLVQLKESPADSIAGENGLPENAVHAVLQDRQGFLWVATRNSGLCKIKDDRVVEIFDQTRGLPGDRVRVLLEDPGGGLLIGIEGGGINKLGNGKTTRLTPAGGLPSENVTALLYDRMGALWIGTDKGLKRWAGEEAKTRDGPAGLEGRHVRVLMQGRSGALYAGTKNGLFILSDGTFRQVLSGGGNLEMDILSLYEDEDGVIWIGTGGNGLFRLMDGKADSITKEAGLPDDSILGITGDRGGNLWMSTPSGVLRIRRKDLNDFSEKKIAAVQAAWFDETDGMPSRQCVGTGQPSCWRTEDGKIFYPTVKGVARFDPERVSPSPNPPGVVIEDVLSGDDSLAGKESAALRAAAKMIEFRFTAFDFAAPEKVRFRYRLEGHDRRFIEAPPRGDRSVRYVGLSPGRYRFFVTAADNQGFWNEQGAAFEFGIPPPFYMTPAFLAATGLAVLISIGGGIYLRSRRRAKKRRDKYKTSSLGPEMAEVLASKLLALMEREKLFLNPELTLRDLSQRLKVHYNHLSRIINERFGLSYNDFVNRYRIEEAKRLLADPAEKERSILDITLSSGFYSKSVFNTAFKKFAGQTPSEYRERNS